MKPWTPAPHLALMLSAQAEALGADYLKLIYADGVFQGVRPISAEQLMRGERGYALTPSAYGGEWSLTLGASAQQKELADKVHLTFVGNTVALTESGATIGKLMARLSSAAASSCFRVGSERLPALKSWVENSVRSGARADLNTERSFGPLRVQLLTHRGGGGAEAAQDLAEVDVLMSRTGQPAMGA
ncbi:hypothetical protein FNU79_05110 [Deinococcus detaillensis]|uniref:Uncharacterized protein n=1 Tax=Deinococcus detaillensis TaxID=2592048 RepID=A0A553V4E8_9DEIO|nr:hypothetical protein [Deinococcus detaillensis]TSA87264.1 hypothetical protein FNU79_05110 [Deinococcus detaillensis]